MREYNLRYDRPEPVREASRRKTPAGIEDIIKTERPEMNKLINLRTKMENSHGKMIVVTGRVGKSSIKPNGSKRKKEVFYSEFIRYHNVNLKMMSKMILLLLTHILLLSYVKRLRCLKKVSHG